MVEKYMKNGGEIIKKTNWLSQDESGPLDESGGLDSITVSTHHKHQINTDPDQRV